MNGGQRLSDVLEADHRDLDERWDRFCEMRASRRVERQELLDSFREDLLRHIAVEEEILFPLLQYSDATPRDLRDRLLAEHRQIREVLGRLATELATDGSLAEELSVDLVNILREHNAREEAFAYPWLDDHVTAVQLRETRERLGLDSGP